MQTRRDDSQTGFREVAEEISKQPEKLDRDILKEYFYWSWRCVFFVLLITVAGNLNFHEGVAASFEHISATKWAVLIGGAFVFGPLIIIAWSYLWAWVHDRFQ